MKLIGLAVMGLMVILPVVSQAVDSLAGTYVAGGGPHEVRFLALTQSANMLAGSLTSIAADESGGINLQTEDLAGRVDGSVITLNSATLHLHGSRNGAALLLSASNTTGPRTAYRYVSVDESVFTRTLANWRLIFAAQTSERHNLAVLTNELTSDINKMQSTGIPADLSSMELDVNNQRAVLGQMTKDLEAIRDVAVRPMSCHQTVQTVEYVYSQSLSKDLRLVQLYSGSPYQSAKMRLKQRLANAPALIDKTMYDALVLQRAIREGKYHLTIDGITPEEATDKVAAYYEIVTKAQSRLLALQSETDQAMKQAREFMAEGKTIVRKVRGCVVSK